MDVSWGSSHIIRVDVGSSAGGANAAGLDMEFMA